ncbi:MAG: TolC family protein [Gemmatimonadota bacterium]
MDIESRLGGVPSAGKAAPHATLRERALVLLVLSATAAAALFLGVRDLLGQSAPGAEPLSIRQVVDLALERSRELEVADLGYRVADEQVAEAWSNVYPQISASADYTRNLQPAVSFLPAQIFDPTAGADDYIKVQFGADNSWAASLTVDQPLFRAGVFVGVGAAARYRSLQSEVVRGQRQSVVTRIRTSYYNLLLSQEQRRLTAESVRRVRQSLDETRALNRAGLASEYDVLRLEVELANLEPNLLRAENQVRSDRRALAVELALAAPEAVEVTGTLAEMDLDDVAANTPANREILSFTGIGDADLMGLAAGGVEPRLDARSDLRQSEFTESLRRTEMRLEQAEYLPEISLFGTYSVNAQQNGRPDFFGSGPLQRATSSLAGVRVSIPVFTGFRRDARIDQKRAALRQAETQTRLMADQARSQVVALAEQVGEARQRARGQSLAVTQARRGFEIASAQFREGLSSQIELTDSEVALRQSEFNYAQAVYDYLVARARLDEAVGNVPGVDGSETQAGA